MTKKLSNKAKQRFIKSVETSLEDAVARYAVVKHNDYFRYNEFEIKRDDQGLYFCKINDRVVFNEIVSIKIALLLCYNYKFKKSESKKEKLLSLNSELGKHKLDLMYYKNSLKTAKLNKEVYYTRIEESQMVVDRITKYIDSLSIAL